MKTFHLKLSAPPPHVYKTCNFTNHPAQNMFKTSRFKHMLGR